MPEKMIKTDCTIFRENGVRETQSFDWPREPGYPRLRDALRLILGGNLEHVTVLHEGKPADMFVHEDGHGEGLARNEAATAIYRCNWMTQHPNAIPESLPWIAGNAVLFSRIVWF